ncbi:MAG: Hpt domain-containing protein [Symbiobacteriaceae bacterium]|nr:Hpt domain-containing protein [Symbiobacteriaceae bacterium]
MNQRIWLSADDSGAPECNFTEGISRMMNNRNLYIRLLTKFRDTDNMTGLRNAVESGDADKIRMEAHTLKGVAANLGLNGLSAKASNLDHAVRDGHMDQVSSLMQLIETSFTLTMEELAAYIAE